jgi:predicted small secreted protein
MRFAIGSTMIVMVLSLSMGLTGCGTLGGAVSGAGSDLQRAGEWIRNK